jgi:hypothetical protein
MSWRECPPERRAPIFRFEREQNDWVGVSSMADIKAGDIFKTLHPLTHENLHIIADGIEEQEVDRADDDECLLAVNNAVKDLARGEGWMVEAWFGSLSEMLERSTQ